MFTSIAGAIAAVAALVLAIMKLINQAKTKEQETADAVAKVESDETDRSIDAVDTQYRMSDPK